jgi:hypothetical protein
MKLRNSFLIAFSILGIGSQTNLLAQNTPWNTAPGSVIGIGTTTPASGTILNVLGKPLFSINTATGFGGGRFFLNRTNNSQYECLLSFSTGGTSTYDWVQGTAYTGAVNSDYVLAGWTGGRVMTALQSNGYLGIGSSAIALAPAARMVVGGDFLVSSATTTLGAAYIQHTGTQYSSFNNPEFTWYGDTKTGIFHPAANIIAFSQNNGTEAMRIGNGTNPYIGLGGITNPIQMIHMNNGAILMQGNVPGVGGAGLLLGGTVGTQPNGQYGIQYETAAQASAPNGGLNFWKPFLSTGLGGNNYLFLSDNSMVGVNTANPTAQLTVNGTTLIGDPAAVNLPTGYKLYVQTGILTEKVRVSVVNSGTWADYVFGDKYALPSLKDVSSYIKANKHLPGVPAAQEVEKNGVDMVEMDAILLKKVEELTLYILEQNKRIESLEKVIEQKQ